MPTLWAEGVEYGSSIKTINSDWYLNCGFLFLSSLPSTSGMAPITEKCWRAPSPPTLMSSGYYKRQVPLHNIVVGCCLLTLLFLWCLCLRAHPLLTYCLWLCASMSFRQSITSFNEWGEGTQIEPARSSGGASAAYLTYGRNPFLYLEITAEYARKFRGEFHEGPGTNQEREL